MQKQENSITPGTDLPDGINIDTIIELKQEITNLNIEKDCSQYLLKNISTLQREKKEMGKDLEQLKNQLNDSKKLMHFSDKKNEQLAKENETSNEDLESVSQLYLNLQANMTAMRKELENTNKNYTALQEKKSQSSNHLNREIETLKLQIINLNSNLDQKTEHNIELQKQLTNLKIQDQKDFELKLDQAEKDLESVLVQKDKLKAIIEKNTNEHQIAITELNDEICKLNDILKIQDGQNISLKETIVKNTNEHQIAITELNDEICKLNDDMKIQSDENISLKTIIEENTNEYETIITQLNHEVSKGNDDIRSKADEIISFKAKIDVLINRKQIDAFEIDGLKKQNAELMCINTGMSNDLLIRNKNLNEMIQRCDDNETKNKDLILQIESSKNTLKEKTELAEEYIDNTMLLGSEIKVIKEHNENLKEKIVKSFKKMDELTKENTSLLNIKTQIENEVSANEKINKEQNEKLQKNIQYLTNKNTILHSEKEILKTKVETFQQSNGDIQKKIQDLTNQIESLNSQKEVFGTENKVIQQDNYNLKQKIDELEKQNSSLLDVQTQIENGANAKGKVLKEHNEKLQKQIQDLTNENKNLSSEKEILQSDNKSTQKRNDELQKKITEKNEKIHGLQEDYKCLFDKQTQNENEFSAKEIDFIEHNEILQKKVQYLTNKNDNKVSEKEKDFIEHRDILQKKIEDLEKKVENDIGAKEKACVEQYERLLKNIRDLKKQNESLNLQKELLSSINKETQKHNSELQEIINKAYKKIDELETQKSWINIQTSEIK